MTPSNPEASRLQRMILVREESLARKKRRLREIREACVHAVPQVTGILGDYCESCGTWFYRQIAQPGQTVAICTNRGPEA